MYNTQKPEFCILCNNNISKYCIQHYLKSIKFNHLHNLLPPPITVTVIKYLKEDKLC